MNVVCALLIQDKKILLAQRPLNKSHGGQWEFPGGKVDGDEDFVTALSRELLEELDITVTDFKKLGQVQNEKINLHSFTTPLKSAYFPKEHRAIAWAELDQIEDFELAELDREIVKQSKSELKKALSF
ncbi:MAG: (deoxy)nucleoside triphosphate pyrophosphohydrolase [Bdellovibrionales bacterium]|nr:(deoxy)nucleoside triphosphate pyrophosphohydrolase [Bdellovibrionales bacterium]